MKKENILKVENLGIDFAGLTAVNNFNLQVDTGEIVGLIGPNGAGKTTVFNMLTKVYTPTRGKIYFNGKDITNMDSISTNKEGISRTFQNIRLFNKMSVEDNVKVGMNNKINYSVFDAIFKTKKYKQEEKKAHDKAIELLKIFELDNKADWLSENLPYGQQRRLEIARALASEPRLLLLDEPAAGMNPSETKDLMETIKRIRDELNISILLIEHDMKLIMGICERITVLNYGMVLACGTAEEIKNNKGVIKAYLGD